MYSKAWIAIFAASLVVLFLLFVFTHRAAFRKGKEISIYVDNKRDTTLLYALIILLKQGDSFLQRNGSHPFT